VFSWSFARVHILRIWNFPSLTPDGLVETERRDESCSFWIIRHNEILTSRYMHHTLILTSFTKVETLNIYFQVALVNILWVLLNGRLYQYNWHYVPRLSVTNNLHPLFSVFSIMSLGGHFKEMLYSSYGRSKTSLFPKNLFVTMLNIFILYCGEAPKTRIIWRSLLRNGFNKRAHFSGNE
jgi:hypothetical protein